MRHARPCIHKETRNAALHRCCQARNRTLADCKGLKIADWEAAGIAAENYLAALPDLASIQDIKDYAACINHGIAISVLTPSEGNSMLATARVVLEAIRSEEKAREAETRLKQADLKIEFERARHERLMAKLQRQETAQPAG
jgi:hypothetical protein